MGEMDNQRKYMGLPMCVGRSKKVIFQMLKQRIWDRDNGWNEKLLSQAGWETLVKSVLQAIPTYAMGVFKLPASFCDEVRSIVSNFW